MNKRNLLTDNLFLICSVMWYFVAAVKFYNGSTGALTWFCIGSCYLCIYYIQLTRRRKEQADQENGNA